MIPIQLVYNPNPSHLSIRPIRIHVGVWNYIHVVSMTNNIRIITLQYFSNMSAEQCQQSKPKLNSVLSVETMILLCYVQRIFIRFHRATIGAIRNFSMEIT